MVILGFGSLAELMHLIG